jgi:hypothetical protein
MLIDQRLAAVGTANLDNRSFRLNFEITAFSTDRKFVDEVRPCWPRISTMPGKLEEDSPESRILVPGRVPCGEVARADPMKTKRPDAMNGRALGKTHRTATLARSGRWRTMFASILRQWSKLVRLLSSSALRVKEPHCTMVSSTLRRPHRFMISLVGL